MSPDGEQFKSDNWYSENIYVTPFDLVMEFLTLKGEFPTPEE
jgi:hypothetical protein